MKRLEWTGEALLTDLDLASLRCLVCGCKADGNTMRVTQAEDDRWLAICDDCCDFFGAVSAWRRAFRIYDAIAQAKGNACASVHPRREAASAGCG